MAATPKPVEATWSHAISPENHGPLVIIAACLMMVGMLFFLVIRGAVRWPWTKLVGLDDILAGVGSLFAVGQTIAVFRAVHYGLGRHADELGASSVASMEKALYTGDILFVIALTVSRLAMSGFLLRLSSSKPYILTARILSGIVGTWGLAALFAVAIRLDTTRPWTLTRSAVSETTKVWTGIGAAGTLIEIAFLMFPVVLIWNLQMPVQSKVTVIIGFAFRLPVIAFTVLRIVSFHRSLNSGSDFSWSFVPPIIYTEIEMHYVMIAMTIPCMHMFLKHFSTGYYATTVDQVDPTATMAATKGSNFYQMSSIGSKHDLAVSNIRVERHGKERDLNLRLDGAKTTSQIGVRGRRIGDETDSLGSDGSEQNIIRKTQTVIVDYGSDRL